MKEEIEKKNFNEVNDIANDANKAVFILVDKSDLWVILYKLPSYNLLLYIRYINFH